MSKKKTKKTERKWTSGINPKSSMSYEKYIRSAFQMIDPRRLTIREYKLADKEEYPAFQRGKDLRIVVFWDNKPAIDTNGRKYEFIIENAFWRQSNKNKEDREYMRDHANIHVKTFHDAVQQGKETAAAKRAKKKTKKTTRKTRSKIGSTQKAFEDAKKK